MASREEVAVNGGRTTRTTAPAIVLAAVALFLARASEGALADRIGAQAHSGAADGGVGEVVRVSVRADTAGPLRLARAAARADAGRAAFLFVVRDSGSPCVTARLVVRG
jgi:hypothetical protein